MLSSRKVISETIAIERLAEIRGRFRETIATGFEHRAKSCGTCETRGVCCLDAHFVNVRISRLEAVAINNAIANLNEPLRSSIYQRIDKAIERFGLDKSNLDKTYACPLFDRDIGCAVHNTAKPLPCINHACYERREDLPPDELLDEAELEIDELNRKVYGRSQPLMSLPVAIKREN
jgi:hypothetical protein